MLPFLDVSRHVSVMASWHESHRPKARRGPAAPSSETHRAARSLLLSIAHRELICAGRADASGME
jgi:hypothetical protein